MFGTISYYCANAWEEHSVRQPGQSASIKQAEYNRKKEDAMHRRDGREWVLPMSHACYGAVHAAMLRALFEPATQQTSHAQTGMREIAILADTTTLLAGANSKKRAERAPLRDITNAVHSDARKAALHAYAETETTDKRSASKASV